jgi:hypothetical protein
MRKFILVDPLISGFVGHFTELGSVVLGAASEFGYSPVALVNKKFPAANGAFRNIEIGRAFTYQRANKWSLGPEGRSYCSRDIWGKPNCRSFALRAYQSVADKLRGVSPNRILRQTSDELLNALRGYELNEGDLVFFQTTDDFMLLIAANAFSRLEGNARLNLAFLWHTPYQKGREAEFENGWPILPHLVRQIDGCDGFLHRHNVLFLSTTEEIKTILNGSTATKRWRDVAYPVNDDFKPLSKSREHLPYRILLGGAQRAEKGKRSLPHAISALWPGTLSTGKWDLTLQASAKDARGLIPAKTKKLIGMDSGSTQSSVRILGGALDAASYLSLIRSSDVGLFLYRSRKYYARCSGVFVEMLACGLPVVVPSGSWLSRQLSPIIYQYLDDVKTQFAFENERECTVGEDILSLSSFSSQVSTAVPSDACVLITPNIVNAKAWSYVGVDILTEFEDGEHVLTESRILELGCAKPTRFIVGQQPGRKNIHLRFFVPYGKVPLHLHSLCFSITEPGSVAVPRSAVGIIYNRIDDLPSCFSELDLHLSHYFSTASQNSTSWRHRHSGHVFMNTMETLLQRQQTAIYLKS